MLEALVIVLREGVEASLVLAIVLAYLQKTGRAALAPWVWAGVGLALLGSVAGAWGLTAFQWNPEAFEGVLLLLGAVGVLTLVHWMNRAAKGLRREIEAKVEAAAQQAQGPGWGILVFCALMILREGVETVLFLSAVSIDSDGLSHLVGAGIGLALAVVFAFFLLRGSLRVDLGKFFRVTTLVLYVLAFQMLVGGVHELAESGWIPSTQAIMAFVGPIVRNDTLIFVGALVLALLFVGLARPTAPAPAAAAVSDDPAARRLVRAAELRARNARLGAFASGLVVVGVLAGSILASPGPPPRTAAVPVTDEGGTIAIPLAAVNDGALHFFAVADPQAAGEELRFFAIRKPDGAMQACMDACEICGDLGYYEEAGAVTCRNCAAPINLPTLGQTGGCNPIPVESRVAGDMLLVDAASVYAQRVTAKGIR
jgi:high-affinity iron transporter